MIKLGNMIYAAIVMGLVVMAMLTFVGSMATSYGKTADLNSINKTIEIGEKIKTGYKTFQTDQPSNLLGPAGEIIMGANFVWKFITLFLSLPELIVSFAVDMITAMGIPAEYVGGFYLLVISGAVLSIIYYLMKVEP